MQEADFFFLRDKGAELQSDKVFFSSTKIFVTLYLRHFVTFSKPNLQTES